MSITGQIIIVIGTGAFFVLVAVLGVINILRTPSKKDEYPYNGRQG